MDTWKVGDSKTTDSNLGEEFALIWRNSEVQMVPTREATEQELRDGVKDLEGLCVHAAKNFITATGTFFTEDERDDLLMCLISNAWMEAVRLYDPEKGATILTFTYGRLRLRCYDWMRRNFADERQFVRDLQKRGVSDEEIKAAVTHFRVKPSLDVDSRDTKAALASEDVELAKLFEEGQRAQAELVSVMTDGEVEYEVGTLQDAERVLGINASLLSEEAKFTLVYVALPMANNESLVQIMEANKMTRRALELSMDDLRAELEAQS